MSLIEVAYLLDSCSGNKLPRPSRSFLARINATAKSRATEGDHLGAHCFRFGTAPYAAFSGVDNSILNVIVTPLSP